MYFFAHPLQILLTCKKHEVGNSIFAKSSFSPSVDHCSKPRGYPRKIFCDVLTNMYTITKKILEISGTSP